jgi:hypothetical protein
MSPQAIAPFLPWVGLIAAIVALVASLRACRRKRLIDNLPTSKAQGVFIGLVELKGTAQCEQPLVSYLAGAPCVYYNYAIEERWSRLVTDVETDDRGNRREVTRRESGWTQVDARIESTPFYLQDETGSVLVRPEGARIEAVAVFDRECSTWDPLYFEKGPAGGVMNSDGVRRFTESIIPVQAQTFVVGQARERKDIVAPEIAADPNASEFLVSVRSAEEVSSGLGWQIVLFGLLGAIAAPGGHALGYFAGGQPADAIAVVFFLLELLLYTLVWIVAWVITVFNSLVELRQRVEQGWAQVDIQLKRRHDLIPNLINIVKGYRDHEASTQEALASLRSQLDATPPGEAGGDPRSVQGQISILREAYPQLKADTNFLALQQSLSETEQRIALARSYFNSIATFYNTRLQVVPDGAIARLGGMKPRPLMEANEFERAPVAVQFTAPPAGETPAGAVPAADATPAPPPNV